MHVAEKLIVKSFDNKRGKGQDNTALPSTRITFTGGNIISMYIIRTDILDLIDHNRYVIDITHHMHYRYLYVHGAHYQQSNRKNNSYCAVDRGEFIIRNN